MSHRLIGCLPLGRLGKHNTLVLCPSISPHQREIGLIGTLPCLIGMDPEDLRSGYLRTIFVYTPLLVLSPLCLCPQPLLAISFLGAFGVAIYKSRCFQEYLVMSIQVPQQLQLTEEYVSVT